MQRGLKVLTVFVVSGLSKIAGLPQMKAAWIVATGPGAGQAMERLEVIADYFSLNERAGAVRDASWIAGQARDPETDSGDGWRRIWPNWIGSWTSIQRFEPVGCRRRLVCRAADPGAGAGRTDRAGVAGAGSLGSSGILLRDGGVGLAGGEPAGRRRRSFSTGVTRLVDYFRTHQGSNKRVKADSRLT